MTDLVDKWYSLEETAEYLGVTKDTIRNWIKKTDIPCLLYTSYVTSHYSSLFTSHLLYHRKIRITNAYLYKIVLTCAE